MRDDRLVLPVEGINLSVRVMGEGPLVILMHGFPELGRSWQHQILPLAQAGFTVAAPDLRGYGGSSKPKEVSAYGLDAMADDIAGIAGQLGHERWISVGHDWGAPLAWRTALRFPDQVAGVIGMSVPHLPPPRAAADKTFDIRYPNRFYYMRYFQEVGPPEAELERDIPRTMRQIFYSLSGDAPGDWLQPRPIDSLLLEGLAPVPPGPLSFMSDEDLGAYIAAFTDGGFFGPLSWYRNFGSDFEQAKGYGEGIIRQPSAFIYGEKDMVLDMIPGGLDRQRKVLADMRLERMIAGAGHWVQQENPEEVTQAMLSFLRNVEI